MGHTETAPRGSAARRRRRLATLGLAVVSAALLVGCGTPEAEGLHRTHQAGANTAPVRRSARRGAFTVTLVLSRTTAPRGAPIDGALVVVNRTGHRVAIPCLYDGALAVGLASRQIPFDPAFLTVGCGSWLRPGRTVLSRRILTTYQGCGGTDEPACGTPPRPAPLPAGRYRTATAAMGLLPSPPAISVRLR